ncbi:hypothetical protein L916_04827 [Phytophthora nicotianae]|uniref:Transmembrane protein n=1 Tax=Phytophthora nicotianae TaxID=4792 RepID=W2JGT3_PHYNI|nr:hypothetical protein L916_04827 [Phytophthora nicotianae]
MPTPSPTRDGRKAQAVAWKQQCEASKTKSPTTKTEPRRRRRNMEAVSTERPPTMTATYTKQYLQRRRSQADTGHNEQQRRSSGCERMERRRSSMDLGVTEPLNGKEPLLQPQSDEKLLENGNKENGHHHSVDTTVATVPIEDIVDSNGKGFGMENDSRFATIDRDQSVKVTMTKKRKAPCGRSTIVLAVVAGVATVTVAGGVAVCRLYPSTPAAISVRVAARKMEEILITLLTELQPYSKHLQELIRMKSLALLKSERLKHSARATETLWYEGLQSVAGLTAVATVTLELMEGIPRQLRLTVSFLLGALKLSKEWIKSQVQTAFTLIGLELGDSELLDRARSFLMATLSSLAERMRSSLDHFLQMSGLESDVKDVSLSSDEFLTPLDTNQAAIQSLGRELTEHESQALQDVKRFEERRLTIASDTNAILAETRTFALESVVNVKMAALEAIERRLKQLEEQYARSFEQALKEYEKTSRQVEEEGGAEALAEIAVENQALVDAAAALKRTLTTVENSTEHPVHEDHESSKGDELTTEDHSDIENQIPQKIEVLEEPTELAKQDVSDEGADINLGKKEEVQIVAELFKEGLMTVDLAEELSGERSSPEAAESEHLIDEHAPILSDLAEDGQVTADLLVPVAERPNVAEYAPGGIYISEDEVEVVAKTAEESLVTAELESTDNVVNSKVEETLVAEVVVDIDNVVVEMERTQVEVTELLEPHNLSEVNNVEILQEDRIKARLSVPTGGIDLELDVEVGQVAAISSEHGVEHSVADVRTRIATQPEIEKENGKEQAKRTAELTQAASADVTAIEVLSEQTNAETVAKVDKHDAVAEKEPLERDVGTVDDAQQGQMKDTSSIQPEQDVHAAISNEIETLEAVVAKEIKELEQLEQVLLQTEGERDRVEEELRAIAKEEEIWLQSEQAVPHQDVVPDHSTSTMDTIASPEVVADLQSEATLASTSALAQIALLSLMFLVLAAVTGYLLVHYRKRGLLTQPRQRKRWRRFGDLNESDAEEVVLMSDSSDEEDEDQVAARDSHVEVVELTASVEVKATTIEASDEEVGDEENTAETHAIVEEHELVEDEAESKVSRTVVVERVTTTNHTTDHPATSSSDASADDSSASTANTSASTPPASKQKTPDTSQRPRRSRRQSRM